MTRFCPQKQTLWTGHSLEAPHRCTSNEYPQHTISLRNKKIKSVLWIEVPYIDMWLHEICRAVGHVSLKFVHLAYHSILEGVSGKYFSCFFTKTYVVGTHKKRLIGELLLSSHNMFLWRNK